MRHSIQRLGVVAGLGALGLLIALAGSVGPQAQPAGAAATPAFERGRYLVEQVAMCADCHTPMTPKGPNMEKHLQGAILDFAPRNPVPGWMGFAPGIKGLPKGWTRDNMVHFLQTGEKPGKVQCGPPMPRYRFNAEDADAVAEYLMGLK